MTKSDLGETWRDEVERSFEFLRLEGFAGPVFTQRGAAEYRSGELEIVTYFGGRYSELSTHVASFNTDPKLRAELSDLFVGAGLGPAQAIGHIGRSEHSIREAVASQAVALRALVPLLKEPRRKLLEKYGRPYLFPDELARQLHDCEPLGKTP